MNILSKILLTSISFLTFLFLIFITYIVSSYWSFEKPYYEESKEGIYWLFKNSNWFFSFTDELEKSKLYINKVNLSDIVIYSTWSIKKNNTPGNIEISITPWIYYFDLKEINDKYTITWSGFEIKNKWPWSFFINNLEQKKTMVISLNTILELNLQTTKTKELVTTVDLYPHTYLLFNPVKNIFLRNSDLLKISQIFSIWYFNDKMISNTKINDTIIELVSLKDEYQTENIKDIIEFIQTEHKTKNTVLQKFINSNFWILSGELLINKYMGFLKNPKKKSLYYKNLIIRNLQYLILNEELDKDTVNKIINYMLLLKEIDTEWYNEIFKILIFYYDSVINNNPTIIWKINISDLIFKINNPNLNSTYKNTSLFSLEKTYFEYDYLTGKDFYKEIAHFREKYFDEQNIITDSSSTSKSNTKNIKHIDYLLFFLENILVWDFSSSWENTSELIKIFSVYIKLANSFYTDNDDTIKRTWIFTYAKILTNFEEIIKTKYFEDKRETNNLLILNKNNSLLSTEINELSENIKNIFEFYKNYNVYLNPTTNNKDKFIVKQYEYSELNFNEIFLALKDYEDYSSQYDKIKKELIDIQSVNQESNVNEVKLTTQKALTYLKQFNWVQTDKVKIEIMDYNYCIDPSPENEWLQTEIVPYCYKIENLDIDWNNTSMLLFPYEENTIEEIVVAGIEKTGSYKLDELEIKMAEKTKTESIDKDKYIFANILINYFGQKEINIYENNPSWNDDDDPTIVIEEDSIIKVIKRNKLLWEEWDFANLWWFIDIHYNDLIVQIIDNNYSIDINNSTFNIRTNNNKYFYWELSSKYNFADHNFENPQLKLIDNLNQKDLLLWNSIYIRWTYNVNQIQEEIKEVFEKYEKINYIVSNISQILRINNIKITYSKTSKQVVFETSYNSNTIQCILNWDNITGFKINGVEKLWYSMDYATIQNILNNIK